MTAPIPAISRRAVSSRAAAAILPAAGCNGPSPCVVTTGKSVVTASWPTVTVKGVEAIEGPDRFRGADDDAQRPVARTTVQEGGGAMPPASPARPGAGRSQARGDGRGA